MDREVQLLWGLGLLRVRGGIIPIARDEPPHRGRGQVQAQQDHGEAVEDVGEWVRKPGLVPHPDRDLLGAVLEVGLLRLHRDAGGDDVHHCAHAEHVVALAQDFDQGVVIGGPCQGLEFGMQDCPLQAAQIVIHELKAVVHAHVGADVEVRQLCLEPDLVLQEGAL